MIRKAGGNHVCRPDVCHKGPIGRKGFCRMCFWHWAHQVRKDGEVSAVRQHGLLLHPRWNGVGPAPVSASAPCTGLPELETNHPFHFKMNPAILMGPKCNHDAGVLLRLPAHPAGGGRPVTRETACEAMLDAIGDHEFHCAAYSSNDAHTSWDCCKPCRTPRVPRSSRSKLLATLAKIFLCTRKFAGRCTAFSLVQIAACTKVSPRC